MAWFLRRQPGRLPAFIGHITECYDNDRAEAVQRVQRRIWWCDYRGLDWKTDAEFLDAFARQRSVIMRYTELLTWLETITPGDGDKVT